MSSSRKLYTDDGTPNIILVNGCFGFVLAVTAARKDSVQAALAAMRASSAVTRRSMASAREPLTRTTSPGASA